MAENFGKVRSGGIGAQRGVRVIGLCPTLKQFRDVHGALLAAENASTWAFLGGNLNRSTLRIEWPDGSWFQPLPAEMASSRVGRGMRADLIALDEVDDIDKSVFDSVIRPWFSEPWSLKRILAGGTPRRGRHGLLYHLHALGRSSDPRHSRYFSRIFTYRDSPEIVDAAEVADAQATMDPSAFAREWLCDFDSAEGLVYQFDEDFHVATPPDPRYLTKVGLGIDHGWQDPGVFLLCGVQGHGADSVLWVLDEVYRSEWPNAEWDKLASTAYHGLDAYPDPSRPDRIHDLRKAGLRVHDVDNSIEAGVARIANLMAKRQHEDGTTTTRFRVAPHCANVIRELKSYKRKPDPQYVGRFLEQIIDRDNHCLVGETLVAAERGSVPLRDVRVGERVWTREGLRRVEWSGQTLACAPIWQATTTHGLIEGTPDHKVWTENRGWARLDSLRYDDILVACENTGQASAASSRAKAFDDTPSPLAELSACTGVQTSTAAEARNICTGSSGSALTVRFRRAIMCTISTATRWITGSRTWLACQGESTCLSTGATPPPSSQDGVLRIWPRFGRSPSLGIDLRKATPGTWRMQRPRLPCVESSSIFVKCVAGSLSPQSLLTCGSAQTLASPTGGEKQGLITLNANASSAELSSPSVSTRRIRLVPSRVVAVKAATRDAAVYDLTVEGAHEFFANGVLVSNSLDALRYYCSTVFGPLTGGYRHEAPGN